MSTIYLASASDEKLHAVKDGWKLTYSDVPLKVVPLKNSNETPSGVPDQPLNDDILQGALNRLKALIKRLEGSLKVGDYLVAFESGIWVEEIGIGDYEDYGQEGTICLIMKVKDPRGDGPVAYRKSECRQYPYHVITQAVKDGITVLKAQDKLVSAWYKQNPVQCSSRVQVMSDVFAETMKMLFVV